MDTDVFQGTLKQAREAKVKFFFTGIPCKRGHTCKRVTSSNSCYECDLLKYKRHHAKNKDKRNSYSKKYKSENKQRIKEYNAKWQSENKDLAKKIHRSWLERNLPKILASNTNKKAKKISATPSWLDDKDHQLMIALQTIRDRIKKCCGLNFHVDHFVPLNSKLVCGLHVPWNLRLLGAAENIRKGNKLENTYDQF